jgi:hypothetical protein
MQLPSRALESCRMVLTPDMQVQIPAKVAPARRRSSPSTNTMALESLLHIPPFLWLSLLLALPLLTLLHDIYLWLRMPPGPLPAPFLGNRLQLPKSKPWIQFQEWSKTYGPIFTIWIGRRPTVVISDPNIAVELMEKRSAKYSSRPRMVAMGEILWDNASILVQPYGKECKSAKSL